MNRPRGRWITYWPYLGFVLIGLGLAAWQGSVYHDKTTGRVVRARVDDCEIAHSRGAIVTCTGTWPAGPGAEGTVHGVIDGVDIPDIDRTVKVHIHGKKAYAQTRLVAPAIFFFVGILIALGFVYAAWRKIASDRRREPAASGLPSG